MHSSIISTDIPADAFELTPWHLKNSKSLKSGSGCDEVHEHIILLSGFQLENHRMFHNIQGVSKYPYGKFSEVSFGASICHPFICAKEGNKPSLQSLEALRVQMKWLNWLGFGCLGRNILKHLFEAHQMEVQISFLPRRAAARWNLHEALFLVGILKSEEKRMCKKWGKSMQELCQPTCVSYCIKESEAFPIMSTLHEASNLVAS